MEIAAILAPDLKYTNKYILMLILKHEAKSVILTSFSISITFVFDIAARPWAVSQ